MSESLVDAVVDFCNGLEALAVNLRRQIQAKGAVKSGILEEVFDVLAWEKAEGSKLGSYEIAFLKANLPEKWNHAFQILKQNNAIISSRFHEKGFVHSYWLYGEGKIYRKKLGEDKG